MKTLRAAVRMFVFTVITLGLYGLWFVGRIFIPNRIYWRQLIFGAWVSSFVRVSGMKVEVIGTPPKPPFFLVANHLSYVDMAALRAAVVGIFVAKSEIKDWFLAGRMVTDYGMIFIDRVNRRDIPRAGRLIIERLEAGEGVIVFPEGTSTKGEEVLPFNSSFLEFAARTDTPVSYAALSYRNPPGEPPASMTACWWDDIGFFPHMLRLFRVREFTAIVSFGDEPVMDTDRKQLAHDLRQRVIEKFIPVI